MMDWVYEFNLFHWTVLGILVGYTFLWLTGAEFLKEPEKRFPRISALDQYFLSEFGFILMHVRNFVFWLILLSAFLIIT